ncbi:MAG: hypothetical protein ACR2J8_15390, partial [Thermomicrobiales bacterium]
MTSATVSGTAALVPGQPLSFELLATDPRSDARRGVLSLAHGLVQTPAFMPVGTQATIKTLHPDEVRQTGAQ